MLRKTKIVVTVGPACREPSKMLALIQAGADVFRINASHSTPQEIKDWVHKIRQAEVSAAKAIGILVDLQGPRVRTGPLKDKAPIALKNSEKLSISMTSKPGEAGHITTLCHELPKMVKNGDRILLDNGMMELEVLDVQRDKIQTKVIQGGILGENKGINLPNAPVTLPALGPKDEKDLLAATLSGVDYIALSFVRSEADVLVLKEWLSRKGKHIPIIAKIEKPKAVEHIKPILKVVDAIMVARGDLGIELGVEKVPFIQKELISLANKMKIPVITATQMLESMIENSHPTRAEASDIANAVYDGTDAVMLSGETSIGKHPVEAVHMMAKIILDAERHIGESSAAAILHEKPEVEDALFINAIVHAARHAAKDLEAKAIVVFTRGGKTAALISKFRPLSPIIALTDSEKISRKLTLFRGIFPYKIRYAKTTDAMIRESDKALSGLGYVKAGDPVVILSGRQALPAARYMTKIHRIGEIDLI